MKTSLAYFILALFILQITCETNQETLTETNTESKSTTSDLSTTYKIGSATLTIFLSGFLDKSFFITAFMAFKYSKMMVFLGAFLSLTLMGYISVVMGETIPKYVSSTLIDIVAISLFLLIGLKMLFEGMAMDKDGHGSHSHLDEVQRSIGTGEDEERLVSAHPAEVTKELKLADTDSTASTAQTAAAPEVNGLFKSFSEVFFLIFFAELGDRSQISTIYLTNNFNFSIVFTGVIISNIILTILAIFAGKVVADKISERSLTILAGIIFIGFGIVAFVFSFIDILMGVAPNEGNPDLFLNNNTAIAA